MKFIDYLKRDAGSRWASAPPATLSRLERELASGKRLSELISRRQTFLTDLPMEHLREVTDSYRRYELWYPQAVAIGRRLESIERELISRTTRPHQLSLIERALKLCSAARVEAMARPGVVAAALEIWDSARAEMRRRGRVRSVVGRDDHPLRDEFGDYLNRTEELEGLRSHRWLAMRRGEREGVLRLDLDLDGVPLLEQVAARRDRLGKAAVDRTDESLLQELVLDDLEGAIWFDLDEWARAEAIQFACDAYAGLLRGRPLKVPRVGAVYLGSPRDPVGVAVLDAEGRVLESAEIDPNERGWMDRAVALLTDAGVHHLAVPTDTRSSKRLASLEERLGPTVAVVGARPAALAEGRKALGRKWRGLPRAAASAAVLGRRALDPLAAWGALDPVRVGVGEYQGELDEEDLREALAATRAVVRREARKAPAPPQAVPSGSKPLGPLVRSTADLRPGMTLTGQVTNVTAFGVFVALGLEYEGMIHVSELSDTYVKNPTEVVQIGQQVTAQILEVDAKRRRISLTMKKNRFERDRRQPLTKRGPQRSQALRDLERLFNK